jgi:hypothetical protein
MEYQEKVLNDEDVSNYRFSGEVKTMPKSFVSWWEDNKERIENANSMPYWLRDNKKIIGRKKTDVDVLKGTKNKSQEDIELEKILGVSKGKPMTFQQANEMKGNPHYLQGSYSGYTINCQSCVVANELRRRGFDVEAMMNTRHRDNLSYKLSKSTEKAWIDPIVFKTGELKTALGDDGILNIIKEKIDWKGFNEFTNEVGRYHVSFTWKNGAGGHVIVFERLSDGKHKWYDPQTGETNFFTASYINQILGNLREYRVDNLKLNPEFSGVVAKAGTTKPNKIKYAQKQGGWFETDGADNVMPIFTKDNTSFEYKNGGKVTTHDSRIKNANKNKQEALKFEKELGMAKVFAEHGYKVELIEELSGISSPDAIINGKKVDFKSLSSANNIVRHAKEAIKKQGADMVYFEFDNNNKTLILNEINKLSLKYNIHGKYYFKGKNEIFDF